MKPLFKWIGITLAIAAVLNAQTIPKVTGVKVTASVTSNGVFYEYLYSVTNSGNSTAGIAQIHVDIAQPTKSLLLDSSGLPSGKGFASDVAALNANDRNATPAVASTADAPIAWVVAPSMAGTILWGAATLDATIHPGQAQAGFVIYSRGLPSIRSFSAEPDLDVETLPIAEPTPKTLPVYITALEQIRNQARSAGVTIAPTAPPATFVPIQFLQTIQSYKESSVRQGWIVSSGVANSLDVKLNAALAALQREDSSTASNELRALLNEVKAQSGKSLSSEAVALLQINTSYLLAHMKEQSDDDEARTEEE